jgi:hypothetical protein
LAAASPIDSQLIPRRGAPTKPSRSTESVGQTARRRHAPCSTQHPPSTFSRLLTATPTQQPPCSSQHPAFSADAIHHSSDPAPTWQAAVTCTCTEAIMCLSAPLTSWEQSMGKLSRRWLETAVRASSGQGRYQSMVQPAIRPGNCRGGAVTGRKWNHSLALDGQWVQKLYEQSGANASHCSTQPVGPGPAAGLAAGNLDHLSDSTCQTTVPPTKPTTSTHRL